MYDSVMYDKVKNEWVLVLSKYHRDNLLWLLNACGYPAIEAVKSTGSVSKTQAIEPFTLANTGDWLGEMCLMLMGPSQWPGIVDGDRPNKTFEQLRADAEAWARQWVKTHPEPVPTSTLAVKKDDRW